MNDIFDLTGIEDFTDLSYLNLSNQSVFDRNCS